MKLYIDGDALPNLIKPVLLRAIDRLSLETFVVSNKRITIGESGHIDYVIVGGSPDEADNRIVEMVSEGDLVITADIPLADRIITKKAWAINHRGGLYTEENIKDYLSLRNLMTDIREFGGQTKGPAPFGKKDVQKFSNGFNNFLSKKRS